ncbi:MAG: hypothetical protein JW384_04408 [Nitrosomonadaceae bacterium]|nr:hypothetical protein [Nitrosomonadaceae bacterium]
MQDDIVSGCGCGLKIELNSVPFKNMVKDFDWVEVKCGAAII